MSEIFSWGDNTNGQLGNGDTVGHSVPITVSAFEGRAPVTTVLAGSGHVVAQLEDGTALAWGRNAFGQLGNGTTENRSTPAPVTGLPGIVGVAPGGGQTLFLRDDGTVWGCGAGFFGVLGGTNLRVHPVPVRVEGIEDVTQIVSGGGHCLALTGDGVVHSWGRDDYGQLGDGAAAEERPGRMVVEHSGTGFQTRSVPAAVDGLPEVDSIAAGGGHSLALLADGTLLAWGFNDRGQLGDGTTTHRNTPAVVDGLGRVRAVAGGYHHTLALIDDGTVWAFGLNDLGQVGDGSTTHRLRPVQVSGLSGIRAVAAKGGGGDTAPGGHGHSLALDDAGQVWAWGCNGHGELGDGTTTDRQTPVAVKGLERVRHITAGGEVPAFRETPGGGYGLAVVAG